MIVFGISLVVQMIWYRFVMIQYPHVDGYVFLIMCRFLSLLVLIAITTTMFFTIPDNHDATLDTIHSACNMNLFKHILGIGLIMCVAFFC